MITLETHADLAVAAPQLHGEGDPAGKLILIALDKDGGLAVTAEYPLPDPPDPEVTVRHGARALMLGRGDWAAVKVVALAAYGPEHLARPVTTMILAAMQHIGVEVRDAIRVDRGRCWTYLPCDPECMPGGPGDPVDPLSVTAVAAMTEMYRAHGAPDGS